MAYPPTPHKCPRCRRLLCHRVDVDHTKWPGKRTETGIYRCLHCDLEMEGATVIKGEEKKK